MTRPAQFPARRGVATLLVLWVIALAGLALSTIQSSALRDGMSARRDLARVRARWAARAGIEAALARIEALTEDPDQTNAYAVFDACAEAADGELLGATYALRHTEPDGEYPGVADAHAKLNPALLSADDLMTLPGMTEDIADAILDWVDADDDTRELGAESGFYASMPMPYVPRQGPMRSILELELVAGVDAIDVRGEDWNQNGALDPEEDDGDASWPPDNRDGILDAGWSAILGAGAWDGGLAASGEARLDLRGADPEDVRDRLGVDIDQAQVIVSHGQQVNAAMADFIRQDLSALQPQQGQGQGQGRVGNLTRDELALLMDECTMTDLTGSARPGKLNINTCQAQTLEHFSRLDPAIADSIIFERSARPNGFTSIVDLLDVPAVGRQTLAALSGVLTVRSEAMVVRSLGRDERTGAMVEMIATIDRRSLPAVITELRVR